MTGRHATPAHAPRTYIWAVAACTLSALVSLGFSLAATFSDGLAQINAGYALSRSIALAIVSLALWRWRSRGAALALLAAMTLMQAGDAVVGVAISEPVKYLGPAALALLTGWAAWRLWASSEGSSRP